MEQTIIHSLFMKTATDQVINPCTLPDGAFWMKDETISNIIFSHPEDRNAHNTVFGGFLMRNALELSWVLAYQFW